MAHSPDMALRVHIKKAKDLTLSFGVWINDDGTIGYVLSQFDGKTYTNLSQARVKLNTPDPQRKEIEVTP